VGRVHHHRLALNGPPVHVDALARAFLAAGAEGPPGDDAVPRHLTWSESAPPPLPALCAGHPEVTVGIERFTLLGEAFERLVLRGAEVTVLERQPFAPHADVADPILTATHLADCAPLSAAPLLAAAQRVADQPLQLGPSPTATALDDALLVGAAVGHVCSAALAEPFGDDALGPPAVLDALVALAGAALTAAAAATDPVTAGELAFERAHRLTEAHAVAAAERLWSSPGDADWLMYTLLGAAAVIEDCAVALHQPPPPALAVHYEHGATREERLGHGTARLVATCLQAIVLFGPSGCARN
jgi:hypothetical protein